MNTVYILAVVMDKSPHQIWWFVFSCTLRLFRGKHVEVFEIRKSTQTMLAFPSPRYWRTTLPKDHLAISLYTLPQHLSSFCYTHRSMTPHFLHNIYEYLSNNWTTVSGIIFKMCTYTSILYLISIWIYICNIRYLLLTAASFRSGWSIIFDWFWLL